jgi:hypothetical protein
VLGEGISGIANLFNFIVNPTRFRRVELEARPRLYTIEDGLIEQSRAACIGGSRDVIHDLKRRSTCPKSIKLAKTDKFEKKDL